MPLRKTATHGIQVFSLQASSGGAGTNGTPFGLQGPSANAVSWQVEYGSAPASATILLQASLDEVTYFTIDTSTNVNGEIRQAYTSARFIRARISALGTAVTVTVSFTSGIYGLTESGDIFSFPLVSLIPDGTNGQVLTTNGAGLLTFQTPVSGVAWGSITGTLSNQTDLQTALNLKANLISPSFTTPTLGVAIGTSLALGGATIGSNAIAVTGTFSLSGIFTCGGALNLITTSTDGIVNQNATVATLAVPAQISPRNRLSGTGWDTDNSVSRTVSFFTEVLPTSGTTVVGTWRLGFIDPVALTLSYPVVVSSGGTISVLNGLTAGGAVTAAVNNFVGFSGVTRLYSGPVGAGVNGQLNIVNAENTAGIGFDVTTDGTLQVKARTQSVFGTVKAIHQVSANATTGLGAGILAALTNASIVMTDGTGQVYRIPCII